MAIRAFFQRGFAAVEFAIVSLVLLSFMLGVFECGRLMYLWTALPEVTQRAARAAAMADFSDPAALQALRQAALFRASGPLALAPNVGAANVRIEYLWQDANGSLAPLPQLPACPLANRINCAREPRGPSCISFVRASLCGNGAGCPALAYEAVTQLVPVPDSLPPSVTTVAAEALGYRPGQAPCP